MSRRLISFTSFSLLLELFAMPRLRLANKTRKTRTKISTSWSPIQHGAGRQVSTTRRGHNLSVENYSGPMAVKPRKSIQRDSQRRASSSSTSRSKSKLPALRSGRPHVKLKRVLLHVSSMSELHSWVKHHRNPGAQLSPLPQNPNTACTLCLSISPDLSNASKGAMR